MVMAHDRKHVQEGPVLARRHLHDLTLTWSRDRMRLDAAGFVKGFRSFGLGCFGSPSVRSAAYWLLRGLRLPKGLRVGVT